MSEPNPNPPDLAEIVASLQRRVRLLETAPPRVGGVWVVPNPSVDWVALAKANAWSLVYAFIGLADLIFALKMHDWLLLCGAGAMFAFAWLAWRGTDVGA